MLQLILLVITTNKIILMWKKTGVITFKYRYVYITYGWRRIYTLKSDEVSLNQEIKKLALVLVW